MKCAATKSPTHRLKIIFNNSESADRVLRNGLTIGFARHSTEAYKQQDFSFCGRCLLWGHKGRECRRPSRCYRCGGSDHSTKACKQNTLKCANCQGGHSSAYRGCPFFKTFRSQTTATSAAVTVTVPDQSLSANLETVTTTPMEVAPISRSTSPLHLEMERPPTVDISLQTEPALTFDAITQARPSTLTRQTQTRPTTRAAACQTDVIRTPVPVTTKTEPSSLTGDQLLLLAAGLLYHQWDDDVRLIIAQDILMIAIMALKLDITFPQVMEATDTHRNLFKRLRSDYRHQHTANSSAAAAEIRAKFHHLDDESDDVDIETPFEQEIFKTLQATTTVPQKVKLTKKQQQQQKKGKKPKK